MLRTAVVVGVLALSGAAQAWDAAGHRSVCLKAWSEMEEPARNAVSALLEVTSPEAFAASCTWADEITGERPGTKPWHFVFMPKDERTIDVSRDCRIPDSCVVEQLERHLKLLAGDGPKNVRAEALKFAAHLIGDLHQPLHVAFAEDRGGADIRITFLGRETDMHALWDSALLQAPDPPTRGYTPFLQQLTDRYNRERWAAGSPLDWAQETLWVMRAPPTGYVGNPGNLSFDELYVSQNYLIAIDQLDKAGVRLGMLLNRAFP